MKRPLKFPASFSSFLLVVLSTLPLAYAEQVHDAAQQGDCGRLQRLIKKNSEIVNAKNESGSTPLHCAAYAGQEKAALLLIAKGAEINAAGDAADNYGLTPLHNAARVGHKRAVNLLLSYGSNDPARPIIKK